MNSTLVTFPGGRTRGRSTIVEAVPVGERHGLVVSETPFHPLDHTWPDQPADRGTIGGLPVADCVTGARSPEGEILLGAGIPVRRGDEGWGWLVVHVTDTPLPVGAEVDLEVDAAYRAALSAGHTACHLAALALNAALAGHWRKEIRPDSLGRPDFDQAAITSSRITPHGSVDVYRLGKSLRKKGFTADGLDPEKVALEVNDRLAAWVAADAPVRVEVPGPELTARRTWHCSLPEGEAAIPCGGTHVSRTGDLAGVRVTLTLDDATLTMHTECGG
ncbi:Predicted metal-dependent hydrolase [[Actinomadura] parvosata subsp. kistnae]|uniref:Metal-dependent hydrolase n=1 Tax=[Actinomadura] parvosata subsp. kistnae TaxID=1909395 RepID=A0A1V0AI04_9ACTN|nr:metal-dependent hydrolase [Nonomuraea sp. ATCC 55076]AQZ69799.1 metal-dependent hydrolase [Nonomuraea sp. ATCC 55076]SPL90086.1 Predicted metal-dependent hydrolase [Actinomadura parvosata subsp. kistnae]